MYLSAIYIQRFVKRNLEMYIWFFQPRDFLKNVSFKHTWRNIEKIQRKYAILKFVELLRFKARFHLYLYEKEHLRL